SPAPRTCGVTELRMAYFFLSPHLPSPHLPSFFSFLLPHLPSDFALSHAAFASASAMPLPCMSFMQPAPHLASPHFFSPALSSPATRPCNRSRDRSPGTPTPAPHRRPG